jgi:4-amino-4-deoxy-L-arabinose transferase
VPNTWDEQYHLVVAKNMIEEPFHPKLMPFAPLDYNHGDWSRNHTWLHKPPFFMWLMAGSMKLFGVNLFAARLPSAVLGALMCLIVLALGDRMGNRRAGLWGAWWLAIGHFSISLVAGRYVTDHNDAIFSFLLALSFLLGLKYTHRSSAWIALLFGLTVGAAILTKWMVGALAFGTMGLWALLSGMWKNKWFYPHALLALAATLLLVVPWNIYIHDRFPLEAAHEAMMHREHLWTAVEGHTQAWWYHFKVQKDLFGTSSFLLIPLGIFYFLSKSTSWKTSLFVTLIVVFGIFSYSATKMISFTYSAAALTALLIGWAIDALLTSTSRVMGKMAMRSLVILAALVMILDNGRPALTWEKTRNDGRPQRILRQNYADALRDFESAHNTERSVFVGTPHIMIPLTIWITKGTAYEPEFSEEEYLTVLDQGYELWTFVEEKESIRIIPLEIDDKRE